MCWAHPVRHLPRSARSRVVDPLPVVLVPAPLLNSRRWRDGVVGSRCPHAERAPRGRDIESEMSGVPLFVGSGRRCLPGNAGILHNATARVRSLSSVLYYTARSGLPVLEPWRAYTGRDVLLLFNSPRFATPRLVPRFPVHRGRGTMTWTFRRLCVTGFAVALFTPASSSGQVEIRARAATVTIGGRLHVQAITSSAGAPSPDVLLRRARVSVGIEVTDFFEARLQPDFADDGEVALQDGYLSLNFDPAFEVAGGTDEAPLRDLRDTQQHAAVRDRARRPRSRRGRLHGCRRRVHPQPIHARARPLGARHSGCGFPAPVEASPTRPP